MPGTRQINLQWLLCVCCFLFCATDLAAQMQEAANTAHNKLLDSTEFPTATQCATCHPDQYREWSASPHAYAQLSPVFNAMQATLIKQTNGTLGDFCIRCHTPVGMKQGNPLVLPNRDRSAVSREGVTCITCHRRSLPYGKTSGRFDFAAGDIFEPVYGPDGGAELQRVIESEKFEVNADRGKPGRNIHTSAFQNAQITKPAFCGTCHDVHSPTGFRFEEAFSEYKSSPASKKGITCQDCHMGQEPGTPSGYETKPVAIVGGVPAKARKHANHSFVGPDYSIVHPGLFPHNPAAAELATFDEWLQFDYQAGWGTDDFEDSVAEDYQFPEKWESIADRFEARDLLDTNQELLAQVAQRRKKLLQIGYQLGQIEVAQATQDGIDFRVQFKNGTDGHNVPTGFDGERLVFLRVTVRDENDRLVFQSGDLDPNGDLRDSHSLYVHNGELPLDDYLFSLQSRFIVNMIRGGDREQVLTTNYSLSPLPFIRPPTNATTLVGRPPGGRKHRMTVPPLATRWASYQVSAEALQGSEGPYQAKIQLIAGMIPVNLVHAIQGVGFDYGMSPRKVADAVVAGHQILWERDVNLSTEASREDS